MASDPFTVWTNEQIVLNGSPLIVTGNGKFIAKTSAKSNNTQAKNAILLDVTFSDFVLVGGGNPSLGGWGLRAVVECSDGSNPGNWRRVGAMFEPLRDPAQGTRQLIIAQPNINNPNEGIPQDEWDGSSVTYRIHRQQGILGVDFRVLIEVSESKHGLPDALQSFKVTAFGERYDG